MQFNLTFFNQTGCTTFEAAKEQCVKECHAFIQSQYFLIYLIGLGTILMLLNKENKLLFNFSFGFTIGLIIILLILVR